MEYRKIEEYITVGNLEYAFSGLLGLLARRRKNLDVRRYLALLDAFQSACEEMKWAEHIGYVINLRLGFKEGQNAPPRRELASEYVRMIQEWANSPEGPKDFAEAIARALDREEIYHNEAKINDWPFGVSVLFTGHNGVKVNSEE